MKIHVPPDVQEAINRLKSIKVGYSQALTHDIEGLDLAIRTLTTLHEYRIREVAIDGTPKDRVASDAGQVIAWKPELVSIEDVCGDGTAHRYWQPLDPKQSHD
jgi:hypothetical protein